MATSSSFSPKEFLRKRRPERFSDSIVEEKGNLDRAFLEYFLSSLSSRSQELQFESFAKAICEKVICSNLLEQTGPVAGGDGKTDTQTFPVAEQNRFMWFEGINDSSHKERWAFAVSTRKDWKAKCKEDVKKIVETGRGYVQAFNVTNQYAKADQRSVLEDSLLKTFGIDVRILDLSWLLDQVFKNNLQDIAIETLSIPVSYERTEMFGVNDYRKKIELEALENKIITEVEPKNITIEQVDWFLEVAELSTELEKPEMKCRDLYERAIRISKKFGSNQQLLNSYYSYAWKAHFWLEDIESVEDNLVKAVDCVAESTSSTKWEKIITLITLYKGYLKITGHESNIAIDEIVNRVAEKLIELAKDETKPSNALLAETHLETLKLSSITTINDAAPIFVNIKRIVEKSNNLVGFPFETVFGLFNEMDDIFNEMIEYEDLMDYLIESSSKRDGEIQGAIKYLKRGIKRLESRKTYQAITLIGKALTDLYKEETSDALIVGLRAMSSAYEAVGLFWAARASGVFASSLLIDDFWKRDQLNEQQVKSFMRLCWVELQLGRLGQALQWYEMVQIVQSRIGKQVISDEESMTLDGFVSHLVLNARLDTLKDLESIPNALNRLGLYNSSIFLQFTLGYEQEIKEMFTDNNHDEMLDYAVLVRDYDFGIGIPALDSLLKKRGNLDTYVLGCAVFIDFPLRTPFLEISEAILSTFESFFATAHIQKLHAREGKLFIEVIADDENGLSITHEFDDSGKFLLVQVTCSDFEVETINKSAQAILHDWITDFLIEVLWRVFYVSEPKAFLEKLIADDKAMERTLPFSSSFAGTYNLLGKEALEEAKKLFFEDLPKKFTLIREHDWDHSCAKKAKIEDVNLLHRGTTEASDNLLDPETLKHGDISVQSLIKPRLWDKTIWRAIGFSLYPDGVPGIDLVFEDEAAGDQIFRDLLTEVGVNNNESRLQVNILTGISANAPHSYRVQICENLNTFAPSQLTTAFSRLNTMTPDSNINLMNFIKDFEKAGFCRFSYGAIRNGQMYKPRKVLHKYIKLDSLTIKDAWKVEINSIESTAIQLQDEPFIPDGLEDAPIRKVIKQLKNAKR